MLRTNLSTRPFYNERAVRTGLGAVAALAVGLTLFNAFQVVRLQGQSRDSRQTIAQNDAQARELRDKAAAIRRSIDRSKLDAVQAAAREANSLIDRRTFSWTELLNLFQSTLPPDVRITGVLPQTDSDGRRQVQITVFERRIEDLEAFMDALEKTGVFTNVLSRSDHPNEDGTIQSDLVVHYTPSNAGAASQPAPASESGRAGGNATPANATAATAAAEQPR
jgi:Tfp pilus assembly protein PilN